MVAQTNDIRARFEHVVNLIRNLLAQQMAMDLFALGAMAQAQAEI